MTVFPHSFLYGHFRKIKKETVIVPTFDEYYVEKERDWLEYFDSPPNVTMEYVTKINQIARVD